jgi:hypothetical protein
VTTVTRSPIAYQFDSFTTFPLMHGMSGRNDALPANGDLGYGTGQSASSIGQNRNRFAAALGYDPVSLTLGRQVHGVNVAVVGADDRGRGLPPSFDAFPETDALVTDTPGITLGVLVADCVPILVYDPVRRVLGVVHSGWRGTVGMIASRVIEVMTERFGCQPSDVWCGIGPSIGPCCYQVGPEVIDAWRAIELPDGDTAVRQDGQHLYFFDLWRANQAILESAGVPGRQVEQSNVCVACHSNRYFSHRIWMAERGPRGQMLFAAQLSPTRGGEALV